MTRVFLKTFDSDLESPDLILSLTVGVKLLPPPRGLTCPTKIFVKGNFRTLGDVSNKPPWNHGGGSNLTPTVKRQFCTSGPLWSTRVDHMCVIWPNTFWGLVSIYLKSLCPKYHVRKSKTHHGGSKKTIFLCLQWIDGITTFIFKLPKNWFCQKIFDVSLGCMGASKRCFGVRGVLRNSFEGNLGAFTNIEKKKVQNPFFQAIFTP